MKLGRKVESLDAVDEKYHGLYEQGEDGTFTLGEIGIEGLVPKSKVDEFRKNNLTLQDELKALKDGSLPEEELAAYKEWKEAESQREFESAKKKGEVEKLLKQSDEKWGQKLTTEQEKAKKLSDRLRKTIVKAEFAPLMGKHEADWTLLEGVIGQRVAVDEEDDFSLVINLPDGNRMIGDKGEFATAEDLLSELREHESYGKAFGGKRGFGGGANGNKGDKGGTVKSNPWSKSTWNFTEQSKITRKNPALATRLKDLAAADGE
ncbi:MAG: hypothetical protein ACYS7Y_27005 [Planctomycetota bacterium]|jgi:hypothetical protein